MLSAEKAGCRGTARDERAARCPAWCWGRRSTCRPSRRRGFELDPRTDQYALGCIMYEMLTGVVPFDDASFLTVMFAQASAPVPPMGSRAANLKIPNRWNGW